LSTRACTVSCAEHGPMKHDHELYGWFCRDEGCRACLPDEEVYRLVSGAPDGWADPIPLVVT
jgi:hypothetical protein